MHFVYDLFCHEASIKKFKKRKKLVYSLIYGGGIFISPSPYLIHGAMY